MSAFTQHTQNMYKVPVIPARQMFYKKQEMPNKLDYKAICVFAALGFFLEDDTYYTNLKVLKPGLAYNISHDGYAEHHPWFEWYYEPKERDFDTIVDEFGSLLESIMEEQINTRQVILPLSGGLDSRTQAVALKRLGKKTASYSYFFHGGLNEANYGKKIAKRCGFDFYPLEVQKGYLWNYIERLAQINECYSDFTHPRQMAFIDKFASMGDLFSLGHWGDVLFDDMGVPDDLSFDMQIKVLLKKLVKKSGYELGEQLWEFWHLEGSFKEYVTERVRTLLEKINIVNANARIRAFKSLNWAPRWTSVNLSVFEQIHPITLPYYDERMCNFICSIPERYLAQRKIQIAYIKKYAPDLAEIQWQEHRPFNLYTYQWDKAPWNYPYRIQNKLLTGIRSIVNHEPVQRNWELQFVGDENENGLKKWLFHSPSFKEFISEDIVQMMYEKFLHTDRVWYSHSVSMLLTLSVWSTLFRNSV